MGTARGGVELGPRCAPLGAYAIFFYTGRLDVHLREKSASGHPFRVRDYQRMAVDAFHAGGDVRGGSGVIVLPCGAGKTIVTLGILKKDESGTLVSN